MLDRMFLASASEEKLFVEDVFSSYLYTGNGSTQTITNGIDLSDKGGLVWVKCRNDFLNHYLFDTSRGVNVEINSNTTDANATLSPSLTAFNSNGFSLGSSFYVNYNTLTYASWTFRKAPKFFDVVTYTGTGSARTIAHSLGVAPGCIIVKRTNTTSNWVVYHRSQGTGGASFLNTISGSSVAGASVWNNTAPTATEFSVGSYADTNASGGTYVAYLFAHDTATDGLIQCGSYIGNGSTTGPTVTLGWEPQWLLICGTGTIGGNDQATSGNWQIIDSMRGMPVGSADATLQANLTNAESSVDYVSPTATGFQVVSTSAQVNEAISGTGFPVQYNYIAIRRGPMKTPTVGTSVFAPDRFTGSGAGDFRDYSFSPDLSIARMDPGNFQNNFVLDRLRGWNTGTLPSTSSTSAETASSGRSDGSIRSNSLYLGDSNTVARTLWNFRRAPGFFDEVCYTGNGVANQRISHSLGVAPELIIQKTRSAASSWFVYTASAGIGAYNRLNTNVAQNTSANFWGSSAPTTTDFGFNNVDSGISSGTTCVAYLFASTPGVSKVGSYTGNGSSQTINCGFSSGARFFLVKRTDSTGDWWVYDSARGIVAAADPAFRLNSTAPEITSADAVDTDSTGIIVNQEATCNINVNGATYIYLSVA